MNIKKILVTSAIGIATIGMSVIPVFAASPLQAKPSVYDPNNTGISQSNWVTQEGLKDAGNSNHALYLTKKGTTATVAASGANITFSGKLTELGFDYRNDGWCGAGAPRFNVYTADGTYYFFGCTYGTHTVSTENSNWTRVRFNDSDAVQVGATPWPGFGNVNVTRIDVVFDEGTDVSGNPGFAYLDNLDINGTLIGKPGNAN